MAHTARRLHGASGRGTPRRLSRDSAEQALPKPFLKWVGGKTQLLERILPRMPHEFGTYHEPFVGGGAVFFALARTGRFQGRSVRLTDINRELVDTYRAIRDQPEQVIDALSQHEYDKDHYYAVRAQDPWTLSEAERAARMIFLNRSGFNGLYRVNRRGQFNVPFGRYANPRLCDPDNLRAVSAALAEVEIECRPYDGVLQNARPGDLVYLDPPYVPVSRTASFVGYARDGFDETDQERLAAMVEKLRARGVRVLLSNSDTPWVRQRYSAFDIHRVPARRNINCNSERRGPIGEVLVVV